MNKEYIFKFLNSFMDNNFIYCITSRLYETFMYTYTYVRTNMQSILHIVHWCQFPQTKSKFFLHIHHKIREMNIKQELRTCIFNIQGDSVRSVRRVHLNHSLEGVKDFSHFFRLLTYNFSWTPFRAKPLSTKMKKTFCSYQKKNPLCYCR